MVIVNSYGYDYGFGNGYGYDYDYGFGNGYGYDYSYGYGYGQRTCSQFASIASDILLISLPADDNFKAN